MPFTTSSSAPIVSSRALLPLLLMVVLLAGSGVADAQGVSRVGNSDIAVHVVTEYNQGRFWFTGGSDYGDSLKFLYASGPTFVTSNIIFQVRRNGVTRYYSNLPPNVLPNRKPQDPETGRDMQFRAYDSIWVSADTLRMLWKNLDGYDINLRFMPEKRRTPYDRGSDMLVEFEYTPSSFLGNAELGIMLMLDVYNSNALSTTGGGTGDNSSILTNRGYFPAGSYGRKFQRPFDTIPDWYHVGNFTTGLPLNTFYPIHRLRDTSHGGRRLTEPHLFAIGHWPDFASVGWDLAANSGRQTFSDAATITQWNSLQGEGKVVTAFGMSDREGNNMYTCRDSPFFIDIRAQRVSEQKVANGPFSPQKIDVEMWVTNTEFRFAHNINIELDETILTSPFSSGRLTLDPSTPARQVVKAESGGTGYLRWTLNVAPGAPDTVEAQLQFRYIYGGGPIRTFSQACTPKISILGFRSPPPPVDTVAPVIDRTGSGRDTTAFANFLTFDRHPGYKYDTGLDDVRILSNSNYTLHVSPTPFTRCDTRTNVALSARVIDTTRAAAIVFRVYDCAGNYTDDSVSYTPFPDPFTPRVDTVFVADSGTLVPCNARVYEVMLSDTLQTPVAGDAGFGRIEVVGTAENFDFELNHARGGVPITMFDRFASFRVSVRDTMFDGRIEIRIADAAGNDTTMEFSYCTLPDMLPPIAIAAANGNGKSWRIDVSDSLGWDRGLYAVNILENRGDNMRLLPDPVDIVPGAKARSFGVDVIDDALDGYIVLEITDLKWAGQPQGHADTVVLVYGKVPDERAPNIRFLDVADPQRVLFDVAVDDIHYDGTGLYRYDLGLADVRTLLVSSNIRLITSPSVFAQGDMSMTFRVEVIDTLVLSVADTLVVQATDLAGNVSVDTFYYPIRPDRLVPRLTGEMDAARTVITGQVRDDREYDRGLGSVTIENGVNLDPAFALTGLNGLESTQLSIRVTDPQQPIAGTIVLRDLIGDRDRTAETQQNHSLRLPFSLPVAGVKVVLPEMVEGGEEIYAAVVATRSFSGGEVQSLTFELLGSGSASYLRATALTVGNPVPGRYRVRFVTTATTDYKAGDTLGRIIFGSSSGTGIQRFDLRVSSDAPVVNDDVWSVIALSRDGETVGSLRLPPPLLKVSSDSLSWINGTCERILRTRQGAAKGGLSILGVTPQPVSMAGERSVEIDVRGIPESGAVAELTGSDGRRLASYPISPTSTGALIRLRFDLPAEISSGVYFLRVAATTGVDAARVVVID